jgi:hypothetical protein
VLYWTRVLDRPDPADQDDETGALPAQQAYELRLASANVLTLHPASEAGEGLSARRLHLEDCFDRLGLDMVGIQEGRRREAMRCNGRHYTMVAAAADRAGGAGVELWLHRRLRIEEGSVICLHAEPRRMFVRLALGTTPITVFVAHAPSCESTRASEEATTQW